VSNRGVFGEQTVHHKFMGLLFNTLDIMFLRFTLACFADFSPKMQVQSPLTLHWATL